MVENAHIGFFNTRDSHMPKIKQIYHKVELVFFYLII